MAEIILKEESYKIVGACMEVHRELGMGFKEVIYRDVLEIEFNNTKIPFKRRNHIQFDIKEEFYQENILQILWFLIQ